MSTTFKLARQRLEIITTIIGEVVGSVLALVFYYTIFVPFALGSKLGTDPLRRELNGENFWLNREPISSDLEKAKKQG